MKSCTQECGGVSSLPVTAVEKGIHYFLRDAESTHTPARTHPHVRVFLRQHSAVKELCRRTGGLPWALPPRKQQTVPGGPQNRDRTTCPAPTQGCCKDKTIGKRSAHYKARYTSPTRRLKMKNGTDGRKLGLFSCYSSHQEAQTEKKKTIVLKKNSKVARVFWQAGEPRG